MPPYFRWLSEKCQSFSLKRYMALGIIVNKQIKGTLCSKLKIHTLPCHY